MPSVASQQEKQDQPTKVRLLRAIMLEGKRVEPGTVIEVALSVARDIVGCNRGEFVQ